VKILACPRGYLAKPKDAESAANELTFPAPESHP